MKNIGIQGMNMTAKQLYDQAYENWKHAQQGGATVAKTIKLHQEFLKLKVQLQCEIDAEKRRL